MLRRLATLLCYALIACKSAQATNAPLPAPGDEAQKPPRAEKRAAPKQTVQNKADDAPAETPEEPPPAAQPKPVLIRKAFLNPYENTAFALHMDEEHRKFGTQNRIKRYRKKKYGNSVIEQRSGRKRLYDHNIFLRALFAGKLSYEGSANLSEQFEGAIFLDIGSAILFGEGADTVRDLHEDKKINPHLKIIASDINDASTKKNRYIDTYRKSGEKLPFPVVEIPMMMDKPEHFKNPLKLFLTPEINAVILRSANAGPDLYYDTQEVQRHLKSAVAAFYGKNLIYFFNKYILYKPKERTGFIIIGEIDPEVGINHRVPTWEEIEWSSRKFEEAVRLNPQYVEYQK